MALPDLAGLTEARLAAECPMLRQVGGAADIDAAYASLKAKPAAFVLLLSEGASEPPLAAQFVQRIQAAVRVVMAVSNASDARGDAAAADLLTVRRAVRVALLGWLPEGAADPFAVMGGRLVQLSPNNVVWWQDDFLTSYLEPI